MEIREGERLWNLDERMPEGVDLGDVGLTLLAKVSVDTLGTTEASAADRTDTTP